MNFIYFLSFSLIIFHSSIKASKVRKLINFLEKDAPKTIDKVPNFNEDSIGFRRNKKFDPCEENPKICSNGGRCVPQGGNFYCLCPRTHYGKTCEHIADQTNCELNQCQNNATCVSIPKKKRVVNTPRLADLRAKKKPEEVLSSEELSQLDIEIEYECICRQGFFGLFCDVSEEMKRCEEEHCLSRGKGIFKNGNCSCECEKQFFGDRCEQISPCYETECQNGGVCKDFKDFKAQTVTAKCECPKKLEIVGGTIEGEECEKLSIPKIDPNFEPCRKGGNSDAFFGALIGKVDPKFTTDIEELSHIRNSYDNGHAILARMEKDWCENGGQCVPDVIKLKSGNSYYIHRCECANKLTDGNFCEYKRADFCALTREEVLRGMRWDSKCTDIAHGACVDLMGKPRCVCKPDYTGEICEVFDPCARNPCKHGDCIPIPETADVALGSPKYQCLCPLSAKLENGTNCAKISEGKCKPESCGNGRCVPCETPNDDDLMPLCSQHEQDQGFRCLCEAGFVPPNCKTHANPCYQNLCQNSGTCIAEPETKSYRCQCLNGTSGTLCENVEDACDAFGHNICVHGECVNDQYYHYGFSCSCFDGYDGLNCQIVLPVVQFVFRRVTKSYQFTFPLIICIITLTILLIFQCLSKRKHRIKP